MFLVSIDAAGIMLSAHPVGVRLDDWTADLEAFATAREMYTAGVSLEAVDFELARRVAVATLTAEGEVSEIRYLDAASYQQALATPAAVKAEAGRRIEAAYPLWKQLNISREGTREQKTAMAVTVDAIRHASNQIEVMRPIPADFADETWWTPQH